MGSGNLGETRTRSPPVETQGTWHLASTTPANWASLKAACTAVMGSLLPALLMGPVPGDLQGLAEGSQVQTSRKKGAHCTSNPGDRRLERDLGAGLSYAYACPSASALVLDGRSHTTVDPKADPAHPPRKASLAQPQSCLSSHPLHLRQVLYFERGSVALLPGNLLSLGSYLRSEKEQTGDKPSLWPGTRGLRGLCGQPGPQPTTPQPPEPQAGVSMGGSGFPTQPPTPTPAPLQNYNS